MTQGIYDFPDVVKGDTVNTVSFEVLSGITPIDLTGATIRLQFKNSYNANAVLSLTNTSGIVISAPTLGVFSVTAFTCSFPVGLYVYDIEITVGGEIKTYVKGTINVLNEVTS